MHQPFFDDLRTLMYPSALLHTFGVNGKVSGSVGAAGEIGGGVVVILHGPRGCGFHYRHSARRRHQPFYPLLCSDLTEREIICGGADALRRTVSEAWDRYRPSPHSDRPHPCERYLERGHPRCGGGVPHPGDSGGCRPVGALLSPGQKLFPHAGAGVGPSENHRRQPSGTGA